MLGVGAASSVGSRRSAERGRCVIGPAQTPARRRATGLARLVSQALEAEVVVVGTQLQAAAPTPPTVAGYRGCDDATAHRLLAAVLERCAVQPGGTVVLDLGDDDAITAGPHGARPPLLRALVGAGRQERGPRQLVVAARPRSAPFDAADHELLGEALALLDAEQDTTAHGTREVVDALARLPEPSTDGQGSGIWEQLLRGFVEVTGSTDGFLARELTDAEGQPALRLTFLPDPDWDDATRELYARRAAEGFVFHERDNLFGEVLRTGEPVLTDRPATHPAATGLPPGHPELGCFLGLPLHADGRLVGMVGLANRPGGYDPAMIAPLGPLLAGAAQLLAADQARRQLISEAERRRRADVAARAAEQRFVDLLESNQAVTFELDAAGVVTRISPSWTRQLGHVPSEVVGRRLTDLVDPTEQPRVLEGLEQAARVAGPHGPVEYHIAHVEVGVRRHRAVITPTDDGAGGTAFVGNAIDVTELRHAEEQIRRLVLLDALTGRFNRAGLLEFLRKELSRAHRTGRHLAVLVLDLDGLREDGGQLAGAHREVVLRTIAERWGRRIRGSDSLARFEDDVFGIVLCDLLDAEQVPPIARKLIDALRVEVELPGRAPFQPGGNVGISVFPEDGSGGESLVAAADTARRQGRFGGRNTYTFAD